MTALDMMKDNSSYPSLEMSSGSEDELEDTGEEVPLNISDRFVNLSSDYHAETAPPTKFTKEMLSSVARLHLGVEPVDNGMPSNVQLAETRSTLSSPGRLTSFRERFGRFVRVDAPSGPANPKSIPTNTRSFDRSSSTGAASAQPRVAITVQQGPSSTQESLVRLQRQAGYGVNRVAALGPTHSNTVKLHIYDLIAKDTLMQLPWGCVCEIGKCFNEMNSALHELGTGAYHVGVEVNGIEYAYGATNTPNRTGIFSCMPRKSPGYQYRSTIDLGSRTVLRKSWARVARPDGSGEDYKEIEQHIDGRQVVREMIPKYMGIDYDLLRKNCCTFARDVCLQLNVPDEEIPSWFRNLAESGARTQDIAYATVQPLQLVMSNCEEKNQDGSAIEQEIRGFEAIRKTSRSGKQDVIMVVDAKRVANLETMLPAMRRNLSWAY